MVSAISGPLFLTKQQLASLKDTGPGGKAMFLHNNKTVSQHNLKELGKYLTFERVTRKTKPLQAFGLVNRQNNGLIHQE